MPRVTVAESSGLLLVVALHVIAIVAFVVYALVRNVTRRRAEKALGFTPITPLDPVFLTQVRAFYDRAGQHDKQANVYSKSADGYAVHDAVAVIVSRLNRPA